ncbi:MAG: C39 family peptidase [Elusimicrobiaceae bacterium]|nr:C39 family peptidase [Elusimicrobiaceae bacterium]MBP5403838.1 C39 family peptidase [Elusimicrobiaceae bacterium]
MKKLCLHLLLLICLLASANLVYSRDVRVIPYPEGTKIDEAVLAPQEINHKRSAYFKMPDVFKAVSNKHLTILTHYPTYQQTTEYSCGPAAALTVLWYYGYKDNTEVSLVKKMGTSSQTGTHVKQTADYFRSIGWIVQTNLPGKKTFDTYEKFVSFVLQELKSNHPILVANVDWGGHWRVIIGYDTMGTDSTLDDVLIFADPADTGDHNQDGYGVENGPKFYWSWFMYQLFPESEREQPFVLTYPAQSPMPEKH